ncbi:hypothetical protein [Neorhizobium galegae]|nr:hypothetical protein [Neorhizobium galegae]
MTTTGFFGAGRMAAALVRTLAKSGHDDDDFAMLARPMVRS